VFQNLMTKTFPRRVGLLALLLPVLFIALQSFPQRAQAGLSLPNPSQRGVANPFARPGMWIWYIDSSNGGNLGSIIRQARRAKIGTLYVKSGDGDDTWSQFNRNVIRRFHRAGLKVCGWQYVYGRRPIAEAKVSAAAKRRGADCFVIDAEAEYEGRYASADWYIRKLRALVGNRFPLGLSSFPYVNYHPGFPYSVFLGPGAATANVPQVYWHTIGDSVRSSLEITWEQNSVYKRPIYPVGQTYENPGNRELLAFRRFMLNYGTQPSWWSWQETNSAEWSALSRRVTRVPGYRAYSGHVTLDRGDRGDQVVWLQQHLIAAGYSLEPTGIFATSTYRAVRRFQKSRGLGTDGVVGTRTWNRLMRIVPVRVRWSAAHRRNRSAGISSAGVPSISEPESADIPMVRNELAGTNK
jgi:hypothetical protein